MLNVFFVDCWIIKIGWVWLAKIIVNVVFVFWATDLENIDKLCILGFLLNSMFLLKFIILYTWSYLFSLCDPVAVFFMIKAFKPFMWCKCMVHGFGFLSFVYLFTPFQVAVFASGVDTSATETKGTVLIHTADPSTFWKRRSLMDCSYLWELLTVHIGWVFKLSGSFVMILVCFIVNCFDLFFLLGW